MEKIEQSNKWKVNLIRTLRQAKNQNKIKNSDFKFLISKMVENKPFRLIYNESRGIFTGFEYILE